MKKFKVWSIAAGGALLLLTSCLGETSNTGSFTRVPAVTRLKTASVLADSNVGTVYSPDIMSMGYYGDDPILISFSYDMGSPENANAEQNGYTYVTLTEKPITVDKGIVSPMIGDTTVLLEREIALHSGVATINDYTYFAPYLNGYMFLTSVFEGLTDQKNYWYMNYDVNQEPDTDNGVNVYSLYLRAQKYEDGKTPSGDQAEMRAYDVKYFFQTINQREKSAGKTSFRVKVNYIESINEDGTFKWVSVILPDYAVVQEGEGY